VATLGVRQGDEITLTAVGPDAAALLTAVQPWPTITLVMWMMKRPNQQPPQSRHRPAPEIKDGVLTGIGVSAGVAVAPVYRYRFCFA
jgi:hypothetical protein